jgi:hypothetical protein
MAALCVQAIWMTRAHSISSRGLAPSMNAKLAFTAISQIPAAVLLQVLARGRPPK